MRFKIDWASLIVGSKFTVFALFYFVFEGNFPSTSPRGAYIWRGELTEGFLRYGFGGLMFGGVYTWRGLFSEFYGVLERVQALYTTYPFSMQPSLNLPTTRLNKCSLRSWRYCVAARLKFWWRSCVPKKGVGTRRLKSLTASPLMTAPPSNLTRLYYNGSAAKSHSTSTQYRQLRRLQQMSRPLF